MNRKAKLRRLKVLMQIITDEDNLNYVWSLAQLTTTLNEHLSKSHSVGQGTMISLIKAIPPSSSIRTFKNSYRNIMYYIFREVLKCQKKKTK